MSIERSRIAGNTPAFALLAEGWNELVQEGLTADGDGAPPWLFDDEVLYVVVEREILAVLVYRKTLVVTVKLVYVEPSSRRRGLFKSLLGALGEIARTAGVETIRMQTPSENVPFQAVLRHMKLTVSSVGYDLAAAS